MLKVAVMQPYFFPYIGYWQLINAVNKFVVYDDVNFIKKGWINRNKILLDGKAHLITLPLEKISQWKLINEIFTVSDIKERKSLLKKITCAYKKAPFFDEVFPIIEATINENGSISSVLTKSINTICRYCEVDTEIIISSDIEKDNSWKGQDKIIEICKKLNATDYINLIGGTELYSKQVFAERNIDLHFIKTEDFCYKQFSNSFVSNLSVIDVMMFNSKDEIKKMLCLYSLI